MFVVVVQSFAQNSTQWQGWARRSYEDAGVSGGNIWKACREDGRARVHDLGWSDQGKDGYRAVSNDMGGDCILTDTLFPF